MATQYSGGQPSGYRNKAAQVKNDGQPAGYRNPKAKGQKGIKVGTVVSQATINRIAADGMRFALEKAARSETKGTNASYVEGVKRMYGVARLNAAKAKVVSGGQPSGYRNRAAQVGPGGQPAGYRNKRAQTRTGADRGSMSR